MNLTTLAGQHISRLGLADQYLKDVACVNTAFDAGINYFFFYSLPDQAFVSELKSLIKTNREALFIATGSETRNLNALRHYLEQVRQQLSVDSLDSFFLEYVAPADDEIELEAALQELRQWQTNGLIRYVGASTHNRSIALELIKHYQCDVLMQRYNMAHRSVETNVLPAAQAAKIPVMAFTCTRWGRLLKGHPQWNRTPPTAADCYRYVLQHPAVHLALTGPATKEQLLDNLTAINAPKFTSEEMASWQQYGDLVYGTGQDEFETRWL